MYKAWLLAVVVIVVLLQIVRKDFEFVAFEKRKNEYPRFGVKKFQVDVLVIANFIFVIDSLVYGFYGVALFRVRLLVDVVGCRKYYLAMFRGNLIQFWCWTLFGCDTL